MLDGFDEINTEVQEKIIQLMKTISLLKVDRLYVTIRSHKKDELQDDIHQSPESTSQISRKQCNDDVCKWQGKEIRREVARVMCRKLSKQVSS